MKIEIEVPDSVIEICKDFDIPDNSIPIIFKTYLEERLGISLGWDWISDEFTIWCEESDNISDYQNPNAKNIIKKF